MKPHIIDDDGRESIQEMLRTHRVLLASSRTIPGGPTKTLEANLKGDFIVQLGDSQKYCGYHFNDAIEIYNDLL